MTSTPGTRVEIAPGFEVLSPVRGSEQVGDYDAEIELVAVPGEDGHAGRYACSEVLVRERDGGPPVTSEALRKVPVATLRKALVAKSIVVGGPGVAATTLLARNDAEYTARIRVAGPTDANLKRVAAVYRFALLMDEPPTQSVAEVMGLPRSTAGRWVTAARERDFLGAAEGGKAGG